MGYGLTSLGFGADPGGSPYPDPTAMGFQPQTPMQSAMSSPSSQSDPPTYPTGGNEGILRKTFDGLGMNPTAQAGMLSNLYFESAGLNPSATPGAGHSTLGFAQWTGPRRAALDAFAAAQGTSPTDPSTQSAFMAHEIQTQYPDLVAKMNAAQTPQEAAKIALTDYEGVNPSNANLASMGKDNWNQVLSKHQQYADAFFNGKSPTAATATAGSSPPASAGNSAPGTKNVDDTTVDTSNMPPMTNYRALTNAALVDPSQLGGGQSQLLQQLMQNPQVARALSGQGNTSAMLARMAAGFFSGNGTHSGLAAGFQGMADQQDEDQKNRMGLVSSLLNNQSALQRLGLQNNMEVRRAAMANQGAMDVANLKLKAEMPEHMATVASSLTRNGQMGPGSAANAAADYLHQPHPYSDDEAKQLDQQAYNQKPLPSGIDNQLTRISQGAQAAAANGQKLGQYADWMHQGEANGGFDMTPGAKIRYGAENSNWNITGYQSPAAQKYNGYQSAISGIAGDMMKQQQGPASDHRADLAVKALQGENINSNISGEAHARMGQAAASLQYRNAFSNYNQVLTSQKRSPISQDDFDQRFGTSDPMAGKTNKEVMSYLTPAGTEADNGQGPGQAAPAVGGGSGGIGQTITSPATGNTYQLVSPNQ